MHAPMPRLTFQRPEEPSLSDRMYRTLIFFLLDAGPIEPIERSEYVRLLRGDIRLRKYANQTVRVADW